MKTLLTLALVSVSLAVSAQTKTDYQTTVSAQGPDVYFQLDGTEVDAVGGALTFTRAGIGGFYTVDTFRQLTGAYGFVNQSDGLQLNEDVISGGGSDGAGPFPEANGRGSLSILFRTLDGVPTGQRFVFGQGNTTANGNALGLYFENGANELFGADLRLRVGSVTTSIVASNDVVYSTWHYFAMTWDETRDDGEVIWHLGQVGGALVSGTIDIANDAVVGDNGVVTLGNKADLASGFRNPGAGRVDEFAAWSRELSAGEIAEQFAKLPVPAPPGSTYQDVVAAQSPLHHFKLDGTLTDSVGGVTLLVNGETGEFANDILMNAGSAYSFSAGDDALYIVEDIIPGGGTGPDTAANGSGSISLLFRMLSDTTNTGQRFLFSQGNNSTTRNQLGLFLENTNNAPPNSLKLRVGNGPTTAIVLKDDLIPNAWYYFAMTYDETRNSNPGEVKWYIGPVGGALVSGAINIGDDAVVGDNGTLAIGNRFDMVSGGFRAPGEGIIDEFAVWNGELTLDEIMAQFDAVLNSPDGEPVPLSITHSDGNVTISWPITAGGFELRQTAVLSPPDWQSVLGSPTAGDESYSVTLPAAGTSFFRLIKP